MLKNEYIQIQAIPACTRDGTETLYVKKDNAPRQSELSSAPIACPSSTEVHVIAGIPRRIQRRSRKPCGKNRPKETTCLPMFKRTCGLKVEFVIKRRMRVYLPSTFVTHDEISMPKCERPDNIKVRYQSHDLTFQSNV